MMRTRRPTDPAVRMGIYKSLDDVPERYRLRQFAGAYEGRDVWDDFLTTERLPASEYEEERLDLVGRRWRDFMDDRGRHHAVATPADVEAWATALLDEYAITTAFAYWSRVEQFYDWLRWHPDHPHRYTPVLMAAVTGDAAQTLWEYKINA